MSLRDYNLGMRVLVPLLALLLSSALSAEVYKYVDDGVVTYTNIKPPRSDYTVVSLKCRKCARWRRQVDWNTVRLRPQIFESEIEAACATHAVDQALVRAVIHAESDFRPAVVSDMGAVGLMQLMPATARRFGVQELTDPAENIAGGVAYLKFLIDLFEGDVERVAAAYNAGENAVLKYDGVPPYRETRNFVERVKILHRRYARHRLGMS